MKKFRFAEQSIQKNIKCNFENKITDMYVSERDVYIENTMVTASAFIFTTI